MRKYWLLSLVLTLCSVGFAAPMTNQEASDAGKLLGEQQDALITPQINSTTVSTNIPNATANPAETQFFGGGRADNFLPGDNKRISCDTGSPNPDPFQQQSCNAVNLISKAPSQRPQVTVNRNDPMLQREQAVRLDATNVVGGAGISNNPNGLGIAGTYSNCTTTTTQDPGTTELKKCSDFLQATETTVTNACQQSVTTTQTCHQVMSFTVTQGASVPATESFPTNVLQQWGIYGKTPQEVYGAGTTQWPGCFMSAVDAIWWISIDPSGLNRKFIPRCGCTTCVLTYTCQTGYTLLGTSCVPPPTVTETFTDNCINLQAKTN